MEAPFGLFVQQFLPQRSRLRRQTSAGIQQWPQGFQYLVLSTYVLRELRLMNNCARELLILAVQCNYQIHPHPHLFTDWALCFARDLCDLVWCCAQMFLTVLIPSDP